MKSHVHMFYFRRFAFILAFLCLMSLSCATLANAEGNFIAALNRVDVAHDQGRNILYISSGGEILRYDLNASAFLTSFQLGGSLKGMDISPDGDTLAVADNSYADGQNWIYIVDLRTGSNQKITFPLAYYEGGTYSVAYGNDGNGADDGNGGNILVTSSFNGSGWVPLRKYNPATATTSIISSSIRLNTMLSASSDGGTIGFAEADSSSGPWGRYRVSDGNFVERTGYTNGTSWYNYEIGTNRDGTQFAIPTYGGMLIYDSSFSKIATLGQYGGAQPIGVVYHPTQNIVYSAWAETTEVRAHDTATFAQLGSFNFESAFSPTANRAFTQGRLKISRNGALLFATVDGGVRYVNTNAGTPPVAYSQSLQTNEDTPVNVTLGAKAPVGIRLTYKVVTPPQHGVLSGNAANLIYVPAANFSGSDSFSFMANDGMLDSNIATISINVLPVNDPPVAINDTASTRRGKTVLIPVLANDYDADGDKLTVTAVSKPKYGNVKILTGGTLSYVCNCSESKTLTDVFTYTISDGRGGKATAKVTVTVTR
jgi:hypothetical protein